MLRNNSKNSFTLIELLVVIAIVGILSGLIILTMSDATEQARIAKLKVYSNSIRDVSGANLVSEWGFDGLTSPFYSGTVIDTWGLNDCTYLAGSGDTNDKRMNGSSCISNDCLSFDGSNDYLSCGSDSSLNLTNGVTITFWLKLNTLPLVNYTELVNKGGGSDPSYRIRVNTNGDFYMEVYNLAYYYDSHNTKLTTDTWYFIAGTYDNTTGQLFLSLNSDRKLCGSSFAGKLSSTAQAIVIGGNGGRSINGTMDEVRIYNSAIPVSQIQALYLAGLEKLLANGGITKQEYDQRIADLNNNIAKE